ncbi:MAG: NUDIX domain-containing protein [Cryomorphaceae bacterium]|nr:NUDIX domain-containing protein [Cryomorphaceae bacterium]
MYKVHINNATLGINSQLDPKANQSLDFYPDFPWDKVYQQLKFSEVPIYYCVFGASEDDIFSDFKNHFTTIEAAGGIVTYKGDSLLMIHRLGKWDLPKGKMEAGENSKQTALREVEEECGIEGLEIMEGEPIITYHTYELHGVRILKKTYWYRMNAFNRALLTPQTEEGITQVEWVSDKKEIELRIKNSFQNIRDILAKTILKSG